MLLRPVILQPDELEDLTGYTQGTKQLEILRKRGFNRAFIGRKGVILERAHFEAVCAGQIGKASNEIRGIDLSHFGAKK